MIGTKRTREALVKAIMDARYGAGDYDGSNYPGDAADHAPREDHEWLMLTPGPALWRTYVIEVGVEFLTTGGKLTFVMGASDPDDDEPEEFTRAPVLSAFEETMNSLELHALASSPKGAAVKRVVELLLEAVDEQEHQDGEDVWEQWEPDVIASDLALYVQTALPDVPVAQPVPVTSVTYRSHATLADCSCDHHPSLCAFHGRR
jgi:hypothetical protein